MADSMTIVDEKIYVRNISEQNDGSLSLLRKLQQF